MIYTIYKNTNINKTTTIEKQIKIFSHYIKKLKLLNKTFITIFKNKKPTLSSTKTKYNITKKKTLQPLKFILNHQDQLNIQTIHTIKKTIKKFNKKYPKAKL